MCKVGDAVKTLSYITIQCEIDNRQTLAFDLTCKLMEDSEHVAAEVIKKISIMLEEKIVDAKKRCLSL